MRRTGESRLPSPFEATDEQGNINLLHAAVAEGATRFVFASFDVDGVPEFPLSNAKRRAEEAIRKSGIDCTIHRPSLFMQVWLGAAPASRHFPMKMTTVEELAKAQAGTTQA